jgi:branched-chain amino acid transport system substrate-binding protein
MRMAALMEVLAHLTPALKRVYLIGQDYSFGQAVLREAKKPVGRPARPMWQLWGTSCTPWAA